LKGKLIAKRDSNDRMKLAGIDMKTFIRNIMGDNFYSLLKETIESIKLWYLRLCAKSIVLAKIYVLFSSDYNREIMSTINGHKKFKENGAGEGGVNYFLRRSIHRLEKGLSIRPMKSIFALDYIKQTVEAYVRIEKKYLLDSEAIWARDVLKVYFEVVGDNPIIADARSEFEKFNKENELNDIHRAERHVPYRKLEAAQSTIGYEEFLSLTKARRSVRWYSPEPVDRALIDKAIFAATYSPSACNRQPFEFRVIDDPALLKKVVMLPGGITAFADNIPVMIAIIGKQRAYPYPKDRHLIYIDGSLAAMSFMYALETLGLSSCAINWPDIKQREISAKKILNLKDDERIIMWISLGYASEDGMIPYSSKIPLDYIRTYN